MDLFGKPFNLTVEDGRPTYNTCCGVFCTLVVSALFIVLAIEVLIVNDGQTPFAMTTVAQTDVSLSAVDSGFNLAFALIDYSKKDKVERADVATLKAYTYEWGIPTEDGDVKSQVVPLETHQCSNTELGIHDIEGED